MRPFEGIRVIDVTHVLAGPFATYQLAVHGADVIKVEHPDDPDQSRGVGSDKDLNRRKMGTSFLTQASNKRSITLDLKQAKDREILKKLAATADVFVENYRPGAFEALGLGYEALAAINPRLITEKNGSAHAVAAVTGHKTLSEVQRYTARYVTDLATHCLHSELPPIAYRRARTLLGIGTSTFSFHFRTCHNADTDRSFDMRHLGRPELRGPETRALH